MKRSRRVVLTLMGSAAVTAMTSPLATARPVTCGPDDMAVRGFATCQPRAGGFGGSFHHFNDHGHGHGHAGG